MKWLVAKIRLVIPIALTALLTSVFLMVQVCLLESSCHRGLSDIAGAHRRVLHRMTGSQLLRIDSETQATGDLRESFVRDMEHMSESGPYTNSSGSVIPIEVSTSDSLSNRRVLEQYKSSSDAKPSIISPRNNLEVSSPASPMPLYNVVSKSSLAMQRFFHAQLSQEHCKLPNCMDQLSDFDRAWIDYCTQKKRKRDKREGQATRELMGECRFMRGEGRAPVALASLPGSGNTWVRGLLEKATGICTGEACITLSYTTHTLQFLLHERALPNGQYRFSVL